MPLPFVVAASAQSAGRGTGTRVWLSPPGGLYFTLALPPVGTLAPTFAGFALGVAAAEVLTERGAPAGLKWPNDLLFASDGHTYGKVAGILGEARGGAVYVGMGLNFRTRPEALVLPSSPDEGSPFPAATLAAHPIAADNPEGLLVAIASRAIEHWEALKTAGTAPLLRKWETLCVHRDRSVSFRDKDGTVFDGRFLGLAEDGAAEVAARGERRTFYAGELRCFW